MLNESGVPASIVAGGEGQFDVLDEGGLVFSKRQEGRFPEQDEILSLVASR